MKKLLVAIALVSVLCPPSFAGGRGGANVTFDPSSYGGNWACFWSAASNKCRGATAHYSNATCDGVTSDHVAMKDWLTYANGLYPAFVNLLIPPECKLHIDSNLGSCSFQADVLAGEVSLPNNSVVWAYGVITDCLWIGGANFPNGALGVKSALINTVSAGSTTVTLVNSGDAAIFSLNRWVAVTGIGNQTFGTSPNTPFFEFRLITNITGSTITFESGLVNSYKSTWPQQFSGDASNPNLGGPATLTLMDPTWNVSGTLLGITNNPPSPSQINIIGRNIITYDVTFGGPSGFAPSASKNIWIFGTITETIELDKNYELFSAYRMYVRSQIIAQSSGGALNFGKVTASGMLGTGLNAIVGDSNITSMFAGPECAGGGNSLLLNSVRYTSTATIYCLDQISHYSFSAGTLTISLANYTGGDGGASASLWVPGYKYFMGDTDGSNTCATPNTFTVSDVQVSGGNVNILTDIVSIPITLTCPNGVRAPSTFSRYHLRSLTQQFISGGGNILNDAATLAP